MHILFETETGLVSYWMLNVLCTCHFDDVAVSKSSSVLHLRWSYHSLVIVIYDGTTWPFWVTAGLSCSCTGIIDSLDDTDQLLSSTSKYFEPNSDSVRDALHWNRLLYVVTVVCWKIVQFTQLPFKSSVHVFSSGPSDLRNTVMSTRRLSYEHFWWLLSKELV